jgi:dTMP kinase
MRGVFIVIDGGDGSGTTSMSKRVVEQLTSEGKAALWTREPGGSPYAEKIRELILSPDAKHADAETMFGLFWAARRDHLMRTILPAVNAGTIVISDRFDSSTWAYQIRAQKCSQLIDLFHAMRAHYLADCTPSKYIFLDVEPSVGLARTKKRGDTQNHFDERTLSFHKSVRQGFAEFMLTVPSLTIDASEPEEEVFKKVYTAVIS